MMNSLVQPRPVHAVGEDSDGLAGGRRDALDNGRDELVKAMRQASSASGPGLLTGKKTRAYQDMLDEEMARAMAQSGGLGVADFMLRDMVRRQGAGQKKDSSPAPDAPMVMAEANRPPGGAE